MDFAWISVMVVNFISLIAFRVKSDTPRSINDSKLSEVRFPPETVKAPEKRRHYF